ncbi:MAG: hypothetical protein AAGC84_18815 [Pseudomonas sp.]
MAPSASFRPSYNLDPFAVSFIVKPDAPVKVRFTWFASMQHRADFELAKLDLTSLGHAVAAIEANALPVKFVFNRFFNRVSITVTAREGQWLKGRAVYWFGYAGSFSGHWPSLVQLYNDALAAQKGNPGPQ